ncbi:hypothetical protein [Pseudoruegeria sp. HB172150]|uniref:hypothetical protein n=1 Tax=Pseudoruegeria sp. HB172150 TaxID=2721164 RepID=UPI0015521289|nr:hypothetical protein [Pseudoruegeria sp. HB172150]
MTDDELLAVPAYAANFKNISDRIVKASVEKYGVTLDPRSLLKINGVRLFVQTGEEFGPDFLEQAVNTLPEFEGIRVAAGRQQAIDSVNAEEADAAEAELMALKPADRIAEARRMQRVRAAAGDPPAPEKTPEKRLAEIDKSLKTTRDPGTRMALGRERERLTDALKAKTAQEGGQ